MVVCTWRNELFLWLSHFNRNVRAILMLMQLRFGKSFCTILRLLDRFKSHICAYFINSLTLTFPSSLIVRTVCVDVKQYWNWNPFLARELVLPSVQNIPSFRTESTDQRSLPYQAPAVWNSSLFLSVILPLLVLSNRPRKSFSFQKPFLQVPLLWDARANTTTKTRIAYGNSHLACE